MKNVRIWLMLTANSFQQMLTNKAAVLIFVFAKSLRILLFTYFLLLIFKNSAYLGGFSRDQIIFFYLSFNLLDTFAQLFFREVYRFRQLIINGNFDFVLTKPINPLIRVLVGGADVFDLIIGIFLIIITVWFGITRLHPSVASWIGYILLLANGLFLSAAFYIIVLSLGILIFSIDHLVMIYRDLTSLMRIPVDLYTQPLRSLLIFVIPIGVMFTFPAKVLMGLLNLQTLTLSLLVGLIVLMISLRIWHSSLRFYQSASS
jgi:ABC-2 type transport system permease protein